MANKIYSTVMFYSNFPINNFSHQFFHKDRETRNEMFDKYCNVKIDGKDKGKVEGVNYFTKLATVNISNLTFRLKLQNPSYKTPSAYRTAMDYNYGVLIQEDKRYYFFVDDVEWSSNVVTAVFHCSCDWWQTYCYDVDFKKSLVEREHTTDDIFGKYLLDEELPTSEYIIQGVKTIKPTKSLYYCMSISDVDIVWTDIHKTDHPDLFYEYGLGISQIVIGSTNPSVMQDAVNIFVSNGKIDSINSFFVAPTDNCNKIENIIVGDKGGDHDAQVDIIVPRNTFDREDLSRLNNFDGFYPNNNKCFIYPYHFVNITNYMGNSLIAKFELLNDNSKNTVYFDYTFPATQEGAPVGYLYGYDGLDINLDTSIVGQTNAQLPFITNTYDAWYSINQYSVNTQRENANRTFNTTEDIATSKLIYGEINNYGKYRLDSAQNAFDLPSTILNGGKQGGLATPNNMIGGVSSGIGSQLSTFGNAIINAGNIYRDYKYTMQEAKTKLKNTKAEIDATLKSQQARGDILHGSYCPTLLNLKSRVGFQMQRMRVTKECAKVIDNYFDMFGYKINQYKNVQFNSRPLWNYVKTASVNVIGNVPQVALEVIRAMFDNGVTIWHTLSGMYNYDGAHNKVS